MTLRPLLWVLLVLGAAVILAAARCGTASDRDGDQT